MAKVELPRYKAFPRPTEGTKLQKIKGSISWIREGFKEKSWNFPIGGEGVQAKSQMFISTEFGTLRQGGR